MLEASLVEALFRSTVSLLASFSGLFSSTGVTVTEDKSTQDLNSFRVTDLRDTTYANKQLCYLDSEEHVERNFIKRVASRVGEIVDVDVLQSVSRRPWSATIVPGCLEGTFTDILVSHPSNGRTQRPDVLDKTKR